MDSRKREVDEEGEAFLHAPESGSSESVAADSSIQRPWHGGGNGRGRGPTWYLRLLLEISMAVTIVYLVVAKPFIVSRETVRLSPVPRFPRKIYTFFDNPRYVRGDMWFNETLTLRTLHNWIELSSGSRGYVVIPDRENYDLPEPYDVPLDRYRDGKGFMVTVFHQLHCLSYLAEHWQRGYMGVNLTDEVAHHTAHCFNYLRQGIMCSADTTLEGKTAAGPGEGSEHECTDYDALLKWANENSSMKWRQGLLPADSIL